MSNFDPIPRLQQIAATIEDGGHFDSPATAAHYINCAIREIERLREERDALFVLTDRLTVERDEMQGELRKAETESSMLRVECGVIAAERDEARREVCQWEHHWDKTSSEQYYADKRGWDCFKEDGK
jgi:hypothetical protein